jgi:hypothetical protein
VREIVRPLAAHRAFLLGPALALLLSYAYFVAAPAWNQNSRLALTRALVETHSTVIDRYHETTGDKSFRDGHFYSDKAPGTSFLAVIPYAALYTYRVLTDGELPEVTVHPLDPAAAAAGDLPDPSARQPGDVLVYNQTHRLALWLCGLFAVALPSLFGVAAVFLLALQELEDRRGAMFVAFAYAIATPAFVYSTVLYGHQACGALLVCAYAVIALAPARAGPRTGAVAGALVGCAVLTEYPAAVVVVILCGWGLVRHGPRFALGMVLGGLPFAGLLALYHTAAFGSPLQTGYDFVYREEFATGMEVRYGLGLPDPRVAGELLFGSYRGLLYLAPILIPAIWGLGARLVDPEPARRGRAIVAVLIAVYFWLLNAGYYMWDGGASAGPRHMVPALPFLALGLAAAWKVTPRVCLVLAGVSALQMLLLAAAAPEATQHSNPLWEYALGKVLSRTPSPAVTGTNLGLLIGLPSLLSLAPILAIWAWAFPRTGGQGLEPAGEGQTDHAPTERGLD